MKTATTKINRTKSTNNKDRAYESFLYELESGNPFNAFQDQQ